MRLNLRTFLKVVFLSKRHCGFQQQIVAILVDIGLDSMPKWSGFGHCAVDKSSVPTVISGNEIMTLFSFSCFSYIYAQMFHGALSV
jgi:hypothetical protein